MNFKNEVIPNINELISKIKKSYEQDKHKRKYTFQELFIKTDKGYAFNNAIKSEIELNSMLNKSSKKDNELSGLYILYDKNNTPMYVGISRTIFRRMRQHFLSESSNQASLVYLIAREKYKKKNINNIVQKKDFPFNKYREEIQKEMRKDWRILFIPETDNFVIYMKEIYIACYEKTYWNTFETH